MAHANKLALWLHKTSLFRHLAFWLSIGALLSVIATVYVLTRGNDILLNVQHIALPLIVLNLIFILALSALVLWRLAVLWISRKQDAIGSRLQTRMILMFCLVSIIPTIIVAVFSVLFLNQGIESWFDKRVSTALDESVAVSEGYLREHKLNIKADALAMANDLNRQAFTLLEDKKKFKQILHTQALLRNLAEAIIFQHNEVIARTELAYHLIIEMEHLLPDAMAKAERGEVVVLTHDGEDKVRALIRLHAFNDTYLLLGRFVDTAILAHLSKTRGSVAEYQRLKEGISRLQIQFSMAFIIVALLLLLASIWGGLLLSGDIVKPITKLVKATQRVRSGHLSTRVAEGHEHDEIGTLNRAFNRMTSELEAQQNALIAANENNNERREFMEAILSNISSAVLVLDKDDKITLTNQRALELLPTDKGINIADTFPEIIPLIEQAKKQKENMVQQHIASKIEDKEKNFLVRIAGNTVGEELDGTLITFDDITDLMVAQRTAAWSDVARRIAHEIKNPLTPIHLATERLKSKFSGQVQDTENYQRYLETISRHVETVRNIVEEFVAFARMPEPKKTPMNLSALVKDILFDEKVVHETISYRDRIDADIQMNGDPQLLQQAIVNLLKNAAEAVEDKANKERSIEIILSAAEGIKLTIHDSGGGFSQNVLDRAAEPYITTKEKGTGLGLAITRKIITDHGGTMDITNTLLGAQIEVRFS